MVESWGPWDQGLSRMGHCYSFAAAVIPSWPVETVQATSLDLIDLARALRAHERAVRRGPDPV